ncbi:MAG: hypothetical protein NC115_08240 [Bacteroidales bacterium]|nr:hypothetical protein [Bacteroidales bacterium]
MAFFLLLSLYYASLSLGFPELTEDMVIHRNYFFRFYRKVYRYSDIEKIKIQSGGFHWPCMRVYVKGKRRFRFYSMDCMSQDSVKPFVEELRSHGVTVECIPYFHKGKQIRL